MPNPMNPVNPNNPTTGMGSFGYMQNPMMSGAGMPGKAPMQAQGVPFKPLPMYQPRGLPNAAAQKANQKF